MTHILQPDIRYWSVARGALVLTACADGSTHGTTVTLTIRTPGSVTTADAALVVIARALQAAADTVRHE